LLQVAVVLPVAQFMPARDGSGIHEDSLETLQMLAATPRVCSVLATYTLAVVGVNTCSLTVTGTVVKALPRSPIPSDFCFLGERMCAFPYFRMWPASIVYLSLVYSTALMLYIF
jgi:hypothetical protein